MILGIIGIAYLLCAAYASWVLSDGYRLDTEWHTLVIFSLMWPFFAGVLLMSYYDEWRYQLREAKDEWRYLLKANEDDCECTIATDTVLTQPASTAKESSATPCGASPSTPTSSTPTTPS